LVKVAIRAGFQVLEPGKLCIVRSFVANFSNLRLDYSFDWLSRLDVMTLISVLIICACLHLGSLWLERSQVGVDLFDVLIWMIKVSVINTLECVEVMIICRLSLEISLWIWSISFWNLSWQVLTNKLVPVISGAIELYFSATSSVSITGWAFWIGIELPHEVRIFTNKIGVVGGLSQLCRVLLVLELWSIVLWLDVMTSVVMGHGGLSIELHSISSLVVTRVEVSLMSID
jgi:hypothetical protein